MDEKRLQLLQMELYAAGEPVSTTTIVLIVMAMMAAAASAYTAIESGKAQKKQARMQAEYQQSQADATAKQARSEQEWAEYRIAVADQQAEVKARTAKTKAMETMQRAGMRKGIVSGTGSLLDEEIRGINELGYTLDLIDWETQIEKTNIRKEQAAYGYRASLAENQGEWAGQVGEFTGDQAVKSSYYTAGSSLLAGGASAVGSYNTAKYQAAMIAK